MLRRRKTIHINPDLSWWDAGWGICICLPVRAHFTASGLHGKQVSLPPVLQRTSALPCSWVTEIAKPLENQGVTLTCPLESSPREGYVSAPPSSLLAFRSTQWLGLGGSYPSLWPVPSGDSMRTEERQGGGRMLDAGQTSLCQLFPTFLHGVPPSQKSLTGRLLLMAQDCCS